MCRPSHSCPLVAGSVGLRRANGTRQRPALAAQAFPRRRRRARTEALSSSAYLEVTLPNGQNYSIPVEEGHSVEEELELFLSRDGRYAGDWVPLQKASRQLFVRYEQIVLVSPTGP